MIHHQPRAAEPSLDARWIISLWIALHAAAGAGGEVRLEADAARAAAAGAILALSTQLDPATAESVAAALARGPAVPPPPSDAAVEDALKRLGIQLYAGDGADGVSVAGFGKIRWTAAIA